MSMNFENPISEEHQQKIREYFDTVAIDERTALFNSRELDNRKIKEIANLTNQPVTIELNDNAEIKVMSDGTRYQVTNKGWIKLS